MYDPSLGGINGSPSRGGCGVPSGRLPWSVAHKTAPCGSIITITTANDPSTPVQAGHIVQTVVADRGPYVRGRDLDLRPDVAAALGISGLGKVAYEVSNHRISLSKFADMGGNQEAFTKITKGLAATGSGNVDKNPGNSITGNDTIDGILKAPGDATIAAGDAVSGAVSSVGDLIGWITDASTWFRVGKGAMGFVFVILGTGAMVYIVGNQIRGSSLGAAVKGK